MADSLFLIFLYKKDNLYLNAGNDNTA